MVVVLGGCWWYSGIVDSDRVRLGTTLLYCCAEGLGSQMVQKGWVGLGAEGLGGIMCRRVA